MDAHDLPDPDRPLPTMRLIPGRLFGLQGRLARPFWGLMGSWAALCGVLASNNLRWEGEDLLSLVLVLLLADLAWGSLWDLAVGTRWLALLAEGRASVRPASLATLPYTQPASPAGRLFQWLNRLVGWWRNGFWPNAGPVLLGLLAAIVLTVVLTLLLPERLRPLNVALVVLLVIGLLQRWRGQAPLVSQAFVMVTLSWLAGYLAFAELGRPSLVLALSFAVSAWGVLRVVSGVLPEQLNEARGGLWLLNAGQVAGVVLLVVLKQPLAAGAMGLLLFGQISLQPSLGYAGEQTQIMRRTWPWLMAAMLVAALALP